MRTELQPWKSAEMQANGAVSPYCETDIIYMKGTLSSVLSLFTGRKWDPYSNR